MVLVLQVDTNAPARLSATMRYLMTYILLKCFAKRVVIDFAGSRRLRDIADREGPRTGSDLRRIDDAMPGQRLLNGRTRLRQHDRHPHLLRSQSAVPEVSESFNLASNETGFLNNCCLHYEVSK